MTRTTDTVVRGPGVAAEAEDPHHARRWLILGVLGLAQLMVVLDATIVNIALPTAQKALAFSDSDRQWIVTAYALAFGSLLLLGGRIADVFGRKRTFLVGLLGFAAASALGGAAGSFEVLVAARALQGVFGALLAPAALSLLTTTFTRPDERGKAFGVFGAIAGAGGAIGLLLGGVLTEYLSWRWCLYVNLAFVAVAAVGAAVLLHHVKATHRPKLDIPGILTASAGLFALVYGFSNAETYDWSDPMSWGFLAAGGVLLAVFAWLQTRVAHPLLPLRVLLDRNRAGSYIAVFISGAGMFGVFLFLTYYAQATLGYSPVKTGLAFLPMVGFLMISATTSTSVLIPRVGPKPLVAAGMAISAAGMVWLTRLDLDSTYAAHILPPLIVLGIGFGLIMAPAMSMGTFGVQASDAGVASATVNTSQQIGGSIGTALLNTLAASAAADYLASRQPTPDVIAHSMLHSYHTAFWWSAGFFAVGAIVCGLLLRAGVPEVDPDAEPVLVH
ncbi:MFS transporter [Phytohabitans rumicis]|uniref:MFS transporter n=1 Tax=Phytohabitans rumicis TaxID=1076125 RepID=A0A6V8LAE3_9ACTN|nr:MFS transporter [Phytohabitans rumicis]GFJ92580.1 MFS transporter [Phytohabitans rumicis]